MVTFLLSFNKLQEYKYFKIQVLCHQKDPAMEDSQSSHRELVYRKMTYELTDSMAEYVCHSVGQYSVCLHYLQTSNQLTPSDSSVSDHGRVCNIVGKCC